MQLSLLQNIICRLELTPFSYTLNILCEVLLNTSIYSRSKHKFSSLHSIRVLFFKTWFEIRLQKDCKHFIETPNKRCIMGKRAGYTTSLKHETNLSFCLLTCLLFCRLLSLFSFRRFSKLPEQISFSLKSYLTIHHPVLVMVTGRVLVFQYLSAQHIARLLV